MTPSNRGLDVRFCDRSDATTVSDDTVGENLAAAEVHDGDVIRPLEDPYSDGASIVILEGSLAPESAVVKMGLQNPDRATGFSGPAVVYDDGYEAIDGIVAGEVQPGQVLVVRRMGPKGGPAMSGPASSVVFALYSVGLENEVAFVSDGRLSGLCNKGLTVAEVSPEAAVGGPIALVEDGGTVSIDVDEKRLELEIDPDELERRRVAAGEPELPASSGWLSIYQRAVRPMSTGAVLVGSDDDGQSTTEAGAANDD